MDAFDEEDNNESFLMVILDCEECKQPIGCRAGDIPPKSCKEH